ncbi:MAG: N-acetyltransferase [Polyangiaceae bacterium]|jgi:UDP-2-acetamido-3-amino-2,3-dideoxy-glucuronate N-acetyltransferase|nr:N-acetyltransferase [Polyangiaceae bacterium]
MAPPRIHPTACVEEGALLGEDTVVWRHVHVMRGARVGARCVLGQGCFVGPGVSIGDACRIQNHVSLFQGVTLEDEVFVGPSVVFTNVKRPRAAHPTPPERFLPTLVRRGASLGANSTVICGVTVGEGALVGAGALVSRDLPPFVLAIGQPARPVRLVCACGLDLPPGLRCSCGRCFEPLPSGGARLL